jgi:hypothetical protein
MQPGSNLQPGTETGMQTDPMQTDPMQPGG